jgi:DNA-binding IclR family transcriptional regulator
MECCVGRTIDSPDVGRYTQAGHDEMPSIEKIHSIFELLRKHYKSGLTNKEISEALGIPPSTCYRILASLRRYDYVHQNRSDSRYVLGFAHLRLADSVVDGIDLAAVCLPYLEDLHFQTDETTFFALYNGKACIAMEVCGQIDTRVSVGRGAIMPMYCAAAGKAVLAFLPDKERRATIDALDLHPHTPQTLVDRPRLEAELAQIRDVGVAFNHQEFHRGISALASPLFNVDNRVVGALALVGTSIDLDQSQMEEHAPLFVEASASVSGRLGSKYPAHILQRWEIVGRVD